MRKILRNKKGMTLVAVMIIMTALVLLCAILLESVMHTLVLTKRHQNIDYAYYAGESAIENWATQIEKEIVVPGIGDGFGVVNTGDAAILKDYGTHIMGKIDTTIFGSQYIDVIDKNSSVTGLNADNSAEVLWQGPLELVDVEFDPATPDQVKLKIGIKGKSNFSYSKPYNTSNKLVYQVKEFMVDLPKLSNQLEGAVYSVGDFFVSNNPSAPVKVKGDVFVFGSYPKETNLQDQYYYGGIYAKNKGYLNIYGNAYSRSFIRTGPYSDIEDESSIYVFKDAIAQCIQSFANKDAIAVLRNAYTFDDIEINGGESVIAVNGSYFGLSEGGTTSNHDESSAIVNSAIIHQQLSPESKKSRVSIGGDVILGGSTFKLYTEGPNIGQAIGTIEDASIAYNDTEGIPHYKFFSGWNVDPYDPIEYHKDIRFNSGDIICEFNQFQVFDIFNPFDVSFDESTEINSWLNSIKSDIYDKSAPADLRGFSSYEMVANGDKIYSNPLGAGLELVYQDDTYISDYYVKNITSNPNPLGSYIIDNVFRDDDNTPRFDEDYWDDVDGTNVFDDLFGRSVDPSEGLTGEALDEAQNGLLGVVKTELLNKTERFAGRQYLGDEWIAQDLNEFDELFEKIDAKGASAYILPIINGDPDFPDGTYDVSELFLTRKSIDIYDVCNDSRNAAKAPGGSFNDDNKYFIITNKDPDVHISVSGTFNGIIVTAGKLILEDGASIYGSVIVAGDGRYEDKDSDGDIDFIPEAKIIEDATDVGNMDDGDYAAVKAVAGLSNFTNPPYIDFFLGLTGEYGEKFNVDGMNKVIDEAEKTTRGANLIPSTYSGEKLNYLNKFARINLLKKFEDNGIPLYDIF